MGALALDTAELVLLRDGERIDLTPRECAVLEVLMRAAGRVVRRERIMALAWPDDADPRSNVLEVLIKRLREKVDRPFGADSIQTVRGAGYRLQVP